MILTYIYFIFTVLLLLSNFFSFEENLDALLQPSFDSPLSKDNSNELSGDDISIERASSKIADNRYVHQKNFIISTFYHLNI